MKKYEKIYTVLLLILCFWFVIAAGMMFMMQRRVQGNTWALQFAAFIMVCYLVAVVLTLILRTTRPNAGRIATKALNIILLIYFPIGTAVGIYGLLKVDKGTEDKSESL